MLLLETERQQKRIEWGTWETPTAQYSFKRIAKPNKIDAYDRRKNEKHWWERKSQCYIHMKLGEMKEEDSQGALVS